MLSQVMAVRFDKTVSTGKTKPCILTCVAEGGNEVELFAKFAAGCEMGSRSLMVEAVSAMLAADLDLPVPEPFLVRVEADFAATIPDVERRSLAEASLGWNFGSRKLPPGYNTFPCGKPVPQVLLVTAAEILAFDVCIVNSDRRRDNPNLLFNDKNFAIYDHELAFLMDSVIGWKPPWLPGAIRLQGFNHIFIDELRGKPIELDRFSGAFAAISDRRLSEYRVALPGEWVGDGVALNKILDYIAELRDNIERAIEELKGALR